MAEWYRPLLGGWARVALLLGSAAFVAVCGIGATVNSGPVDGAAAAVFALALCGQAVAVWPRHSGVPSCDGGALVLPFSRPRLLGRLVTWTGVCAGHGLLLYSPRLPWFAVAAFGGAAVAAYRVLHVVPWRSALRLDPGGVMLVLGRRRTATPWDAVEAVVRGDEQSVYRDNITFHYPGIRLVANDAAERARRDYRWIVDGQRLGVGAPAAYGALVHYWRHPEDRAELADGRAVDRVRRGTL